MIEIAFGLLIVACIGLAGWYIVRRTDTVDKVKQDIDELK